MRKSRTTSNKEVNKLKSITQTVQEEDNMIKASYRPNWNEEHGGTIHLDGSFDFPLDVEIQEVADSLRKRAEEVGGLVSTKRNKTWVKVSCQYGAIKFILESDEPDQPVKRITSIDTRAEKRVTHSIEELVRDGKKTAELKEWIEEQVEKGNMEVKIEKDNERKNIMEM